MSDECTSDSVNADFAQRVVLHGDEIAWEPSPMPGVERRRLDRVQGERDGQRFERVTTIVRYAPGSTFPAHVHGGGEEFIVLDGVFQDDHGDWPAGSYVRNPPRSRHTPGSAPGCTIFVKLWQFDPADRALVHIDLNRLAAVPERDRDGVSASPLFRHGGEDVRIELWEPDAAVSIEAPLGAELFVLEGGFREGDDALRRHSWLRVPAGTALAITAGAHGARVWIKRGFGKIPPDGADRATGLG